MFSLIHVFCSNSTQTASLKLWHSYPKYQTSTVHELMPLWLIFGLEALSWAQTLLFIPGSDRQSKYMLPGFRNVKKFPKDNKTYLIYARFNALQCVKGAENCQSGQKFYIRKSKIQAWSDFHRDPSGKNVPLMVYTFLSNAHPFFYYLFNHQVGILFMKCLWKWGSNCTAQSQA